jgi:hypothetical protein
MPSPEVTTFRAQFRLTLLPLIVPPQDTCVAPAGRPNKVQPIVEPLCESEMDPGWPATTHVPETLIAGVGAGEGAGTGEGAGLGEGAGAGQAGVGIGVGQGTGVGFTGGSLSAGPTVMPPMAPLQFVRLVVQSMATGAVISSIVADPVILMGLSGALAVHRPVPRQLMQSNVNARPPETPPQRE